MIDKNSFKSLCHKGEDTDFLLRGSLELGCRTMWDWTSNNKYFVSIDNIRQWNSKPQQLTLDTLAFTLFACWKKTMVYWCGASWSWDVQTREIWRQTTNISYRLAIFDNKTANQSNLHLILWLSHFFSLCLFKNDTGLPGVGMYKHVRYQTWGQTFGSMKDIRFRRFQPIQFDTFSTIPTSSIWRIDTTWRTSGLQNRCETSRSRNKTRRTSR